MRIWMVFKLAAGFSVHGFSLSLHPIYEALQLGLKQRHFDLSIPS